MCTSASRVVYCSANELSRKAARGLVESVHAERLDVDGTAARAGRPALIVASGSRHEQEMDR